MIRKIFLLALLLLSACAPQAMPASTQTPLPTAAFTSVPSTTTPIPPTPLPTSATDNILNLVLNSHTKWQNLRGAATIEWYSQGVVAQTDKTSFVVSQPDKASIETVVDSPNGKQDFVWMSDGEFCYEIDQATRTYSKSDLPNFATDTSLIPTDISRISPNEVYDHPFALVMSPPIAEYIYPEWFAQGADTPVLLGQNIIAGRAVWVFSDQIGDSDRVTAWIDQGTGLILKYLQYENDQLVVQVTFTSIAYNQQISDSEFSVPADYQEVTGGN